MKAETIGNQLRQRRIRMHAMIEKSREFSQKKK
jgi:hypothetical protein